MARKRDTRNITIDDEISEIKRELAMRKRVYPRKIEVGEMTKDDANWQFTCMQQSLKRLLLMKEHQESNRKMPGLFDHEVN